MATTNPIRLEGSILYYENGIKLGDILAKDDGYYDFWPDNNGGYWEAFVLRAIADMLDEMNKEWDTIIQNDPNI